MKSLKVKITDKSYLLKNFYIMNGGYFRKGLRYCCFGCYVDSKLELLNIINISVFINLATYEILETSP